MELQDFIDAKSASSTRLINFEEAEVRPGFVNGTYILFVSGTAPCANMDVRLAPLIYVQCPDYWGIEVTGTLQGGICLTSVKPFTLTAELSGSGIIGSKGIEVIGASNSEKINVSGGCQGTSLY